MKALLSLAGQISSNVPKSGRHETAQQTSPFLDFLVTFCVKTKSKKEILTIASAFSPKTGSKQLKAATTAHITNFLCGRKRKWNGSLLQQTAVEFMSIQNINNIKMRITKALLC